MTKTIGGTKRAKVAPVVKCFWCKRNATLKDYRTIDEMTGSYPSCKECFNLSTEFLLEREARNEAKGKKCSICMKKYFGYGNNAQPINNGRCCDTCNGKVVMARLENIQK